jgi:hypothetical protein
MLLITVVANGSKESRKKYPLCSDTEVFGIEKKVISFPFEKKS